MTDKQFKKTVWNYYRKHGRDLPWRHDTTPYRILVSEVMLQQTQVDRVIPYFKTWMKEFPSWRALSQASLQDVLKVWKGLGYNRRAKFLLETARIITEKYKGRFPKDPKEIQALPGVGPYTAGAVQVFAFNTPIAFIETNIRTVYIHHFFQNKKQVDDREILPLIERHLTEKPEKNNPREWSREWSREWYWALMDYGAHLKKTEGNASRKSVHYTKQSKFSGSHRQLRTYILHLITENQPLQHSNILENVGVLSDTYRKSKKDVEKVLKELEAEGFIEKKQKTYRIKT